MNERMEIVVSTVAELDKAVEAMLSFAGGRKKIALMGDLGAGKTAFVKAFCRRQKVKENVASPTFSLVNEYVFGDENGRQGLIHHLDLYRLRNLDEALDIGVEEYLFDDDYCFIEWPEIIQDLLPEEMVFIEIEVQGNGSRRFLFSNKKDRTI